MKQKTIRVKTHKRKLSEEYNKRNTKWLGGVRLSQIEDDARELLKTLSQDDVVKKLIKNYPDLPEDQADDIVDMIMIEEYNSK